MEAESCLREVGILWINYSTCYFQFLIVDAHLEVGLYL